MPRVDKDYGTTVVNEQHCVWVTLLSVYIVLSSKGVLTTRTDT